MIETHLTLNKKGQIINYKKTTKTEIAIFQTQKSVKVKEANRISLFAFSFSLFLRFVQFFFFFWI